MRRGVLADPSAPYSRTEAWLYDRVVAPAVLEMGQRIAEDLSREVADGAKLLDVGCGGGHLALEIARRKPSVKVTGVDYSADQVARAEARARDEGLSERAGFIRGSALALPFEDAGFDVVVSVASIKHWSDQAKGLAECVRVLGPGGRLFVFEADRGCRLSDASQFVAQWRLPAPLRIPALALFRTWVAGQAIDLDDARTLLAATGLREASVSRVSGTPALLLSGCK